MNTLTPLKEYQHYDGEAFITFNIISLKQSFVTLAITNRGKISIVDYDIYLNNHGEYFEYGPLNEKIYLEEFEIMES